MKLDNNLITEEEQQFNHEVELLIKNFNLMYSELCKKGKKVGVVLNLHTFYTSESDQLSISREYRKDYEEA